MSVDGLISGMDTTGLVSQLVQAEAAPQAALKTRLSVTQATANAYRSVNTRFDALRTAADAVLKPETWAAKKATNTAPTSVTVAAGSAAAAGSLTFDVINTASAHSMVTAGNWSATSDPHGMAVPIDVRDENGVSAGSITVGGTGTLSDVVTAINASAFGLSATTVKDELGTLRLQVTSRATGAKEKFDLGTPGTFTTATQGRDARITIGTTGPGTTSYGVTSPTNTFANLMDGVTVAVTKAETGVTVTVAADPDAVAAKVQALVDAANSALSGIKNNSDPKGGAAAVLKGDTALRELASRVLTALSSGVGTDSPAIAGVELNKDGTATFTKADFVAALQADPTKVQTVLSGTQAEPGVGRRLLGVAEYATGTTATGSDLTKGILSQLAQGRDQLAKDLTSRIASWDLRLAQRKQTLTRQFTAMETALGTMRNQSTWLAGQLSSLSS
jgi:flagellar hook-associated protein 2